MEKENRTKTIGIRVSDLEEATIARKASDVGLRVGAYGRRVMLGQQLPTPIPEINREAWASLGKLAGNLNQTLHHLNAGFASGVDGVLIKALFAQVQALRADLLGRADEG